MTYAVRWVEPPEAQPRHVDPWRRNLAMKVEPLRRFQWMYRDNPAGPGRLAVLEARGDGDSDGDGDGALPDIVGTAGHGMRAFAAGGRVLRAALLGDVTVDAAHRSATGAFMLMAAVRRHVLPTYDLAYGFPNHRSEPLAARAYRKLGQVTRYALPLRHQRHVQARIAQPALAWGAARALDAARIALIAARAAQAALTHRLIAVDEDGVDERFDQLWRAAAPAYAIAGVRDRAFVRWRFCRRAEGPLEVVAFESRRTGALAGYAALEPIGDAWHVRDLFGRPEDFPLLLRLLCFELVKRGAGSISLRLLGPPRIIAALTDLGFRARPDARTFVCSAGKSAGADAERLLDITRWFLTDADEDA